MSACSVSNEDTANSNSHNHSVIILSSFDFHFPVSLYRGLLCSVHGEVVSALCEFDSQKWNPFEKSDYASMHSSSFCILISSLFQRTKELSVSSSFGTRQRENSTALCALEVNNEFLDKNLATTKLSRKQQIRDVATKVLADQPTNQLIDSQEVDQSFWSFSSTCTKRVEFMII